MKNKYGIIGQMGSGKTTISDYMVKNFGYTRLSLAKPLYQIVENLDNYPSLELFDMFIGAQIGHKHRDIMSQYISLTRDIPNESPKPRERLQKLGTEFGRNKVSKSIWVDILLAKIKRYYPDDNIVIDDVRFLDESEILSKTNFTLVKLELSQEARIERLKSLYGDFDPATLSHASELDFNKMLSDYTLSTEDPFDKLYANLNQILKNGS